MLEWGGVPLTERSFEEVCAVLERGGDNVEVVVEPAPSDEHAALAALGALTGPGSQPPQLLFGTPAYSASYTSFKRFLHLSTLYNLLCFLNHTSSSMFRR